MRSTIDHPKKELLGLFAVLLPLTVAFFWSAVVSGFYSDDNTFLRLIGGISPKEVRGYFDPHWGWLYRPVFLTYFATMKSVFGANAVPFHLFSCALHAANTLLLGWLAFRLLKNREVALLSGTLFFLLTLNSDAVAWISATSTLLSAFFCLFCLHFWLSFKERRSWGFYAATLLCFVLALCSKEDAHVLPFALLFLGVPGQKQQRAWFALPFLGCGLVYAKLAVFAAAHNTLFNIKFAPVATTPLRNLPTVPEFWRWMVERMIGDTSTPYLAYFALPVGLLVLAHLCYSDRILRPLWSWMFLACIILPLEVGTYVRVDRFFYAPFLPLCIVLAAVLTREIKADSPARAFTAVCVLASVVGVSLMAQFPALEDLRDGAFSLPVVFLATLALAWIASRTGRLSWMVPAVLTLVVFATQLSILFPLASLGFFAACSVGVCLVFKRSESWAVALCCSMLLALVLWLVPGLKVSIILALALQLRIQAHQPLKVRETMPSQRLPEAVC